LAAVLISSNLCVSAEPTSDEQAVRATIEGAWRALQLQELEQFKKFCSEGWMLYTARGNKFGAEKLFAVHKANIEDFRLESSNVEVRVAGEMAWATYDAVMSGKLKGETWGGDFIMTNIFERVGGRWTCVHMHESKKPKE